jgi:hypothetical protein
MKRPPIPRESPNIEIKNNEIIDIVTRYEWRITKDRSVEDIDIHEVEKKLSEIETKKEKLIKSITKKCPNFRKIYNEMFKSSMEAYRKQFDSERIKKLKSKTIEIKFEGINTTPSLKDFKEFFLKAGIPPIKGNDLLTGAGRLMDLNTEIKTPKNLEEKYNPPFEKRLYIVLSEERHELLRILSNLVWGTKTYDDEPAAHDIFQHYMETIRNLYLECWKEDELPAEDGETFDGKKYRGRYSLVIDSLQYEKPFPHYGMIPHAIYACIMDFGINHKKLHSRLKQCPYCGSFWITEEKRGKPQKFCSKKCEDRFNQNSRQVDQDNKKRCRSYGRLKAKKDIINYLRESGFTQLKAEEIYNKLTDKCKSSLREFKRTRGQSHDLI